MTTIGPPLGTFACDSVSLKEMLGDTTLACPCCNGRLTPEKLVRLLDDVQKLAQGHMSAAAGPAAQPSASAFPYQGMIIDSHAHMISRTTNMKRWLMPALSLSSSQRSGSGSRVPILAASQIIFR